jgi:hypothetical protein
MPDDTPLTYEQNAGALLRKMMRSSHRDTVYEIAKELSPNDFTVDPHIEAVRDVKAEIASFKEEQKREREARELAEYQTRIDTQRARLKREGYADDGIEKIEALMKSEQIGSYDAAQALYERRYPSRKDDEIPAYDTRSVFDVGMGDTDKESAKELFANPDRWLDRQLRTMKF